MRRNHAALAVAMSVLAPVALVGLAGSGAVNAAPTPVDPGPPTPAAQRLAFASQHHSELVHDLGEGGQVRPFGGDPNAVDTDPSAAGSSVAFVSFRASGDGAERDGEIWFTPNIRADSPQARRLTRDGFVDRHPSLSRDGERVAFASTRNGNTDIWVIGVDGTGLSRVTDSPAVDDWPSWSPDGQRLVFRSTRDDPAGDLYTIGRGGEDLFRLTNDPAVDAEPAWEPDGERIALRTTRWDSDGDLAFTFASGGSVNRIGGIGPGIHGSAPAWTPDGSELAYVNREHDRAGDIYIVPMNSAQIPFPAAGSVPGVAELHPTWTGGGEASWGLLYASSGADGEDSTADIWRVDVDGTDAANLSRRPRSHEDEPAYSPDGNRLAYLATDDEGVRQIVIADANGGAPRRLDTLTPTWSTALSWSPDGSMLAFTHQPPPDDEPPALARRIPGRIVGGDRLLGPGTVPVQTFSHLASPPRVVVVRVDNGSVVTTVPQVNDDDSQFLTGDWDPAWSPDGGTLAFVRAHFVQSETFPTSSVLVERVWLVSVDSAGPGAAALGIPRPFSDRVDCPCGQAQDDARPTWSPDSERVAFVRQTASQFRLLVTDVADPDEAHRLLTYEDDELIEEPAWSPDGQLIAFTGARPDTLRTAVFAIPPTGLDGDEFVVFDEIDEDFAPDWQPFADLRLHAAVDPPAIPQGSTAVATFTVVNDGPVTARGVTVTVTVPDGLTPLTAEPSQGSCDLAARACALGALPPGEAAAIDLTVRGDVQAGYVIAGEVTSDTPDLDLGDNADDATLRVGRGPDLAVTIGVAPSPGYVGGAPIVVTYRIVNEGEFPAPDVRLVANVPRALPVLPGARCAPRVACELGTLLPGQRITVRLVLRPATAVNGVATATVSTTGLDLDQLDNTARRPVVVIQPVLELDPPIGPPGFVTDAVGRDFPPGARVRLTWEPGLTAEDRPVRVRPDGTFRTQVLILRKDVLGERVLRAEPAGGMTFTVEPPTFLVVPGTAQPRDFVERS